MCLYSTDLDFREMPDDNLSKIGNQFEGEVNKAGKAVEKASTNVFATGAKYFNRIRQVNISLKENGRNIGQIRCYSHKPPDY